MIDILESNWRQKLGGLGCVELKKKRGTFGNEMKKWQRHQSNKLKEWHKDMKANKPEEYYKIQYFRFKKIGNYKFETNRGEKVRNLLEKEIADILFRREISYEYEPLVNSGKNYFFPNFLINKKIIVEFIMWRGYQKAYKLRDKIRLLKNKYKIYVVIPKKLHGYYKLLHNHLILGLDEFVPVAQTFLRQ